MKNQTEIRGCYDRGGNLKLVSALPCPDGAPASGQAPLAFAKPTGKEA